MQVLLKIKEFSKPGYLKQRMKLNPDAFLDLYHYHNKNFYSEPDYATYHGSFHKRFY